MQVRSQVQSMQTTNSLSEEARASNLQQKIIDAYWQTLLAGCFDTGYDDARTLFNMWYAQQTLFQILHALSLDRVLLLMFMASIVIGICMVAQFFRRDNPIGMFFSKSINLFPAMATAVGNRRLIRTDKGFIGLGPGLCEPLDHIAICKGGKLPLVLRPKGEDWELIGDCYVHGIMDGAKWEALAEKECREFWLV